MKLQELKTPDGDQLRRLDIRVFVCMLDCAKPEEHAKHLEQVQRKVANHHGRQALHVVWFGVMQDLRRDAEQARAEVRVMGEPGLDKIDEVATPRVGIVNVNTRYS